MDKALRTEANINSYHPICDYLDALQRIAHPGAKADAMLCLAGDPGSREIHFFPLSGNP
ncbi:MAG: hypothetical protein Q4D60_11920 [Eubacteriales bacterium]|nr:hypothetical protein [Eubacteriales bacterium]